MAWKIKISTDMPSGTITREVTANSDAEAIEIRAKAHASTPRGASRTVTAVPSK